MDDKITQLRDRLASVTVEEQESNILRILKENESYLLDLNTGQLLKGVDSDALPLKPVYKSERYAAFKLTLNPEGVVDLRLTGAFYHGFFIEADKFPVIFDSTDEKTSELKSRYGDKIFGLDQISKEDLVGHLRTQIQDYYKNLLVV